MDSKDFRAGRAEGIRDALELVEAPIAAEAIKLDQPAPYMTRTARRVRWQAYRNAASRLRAKLGRMTKGIPVSVEIATRLEKLGV